MHQGSSASSLRKKIWLISCVLVFFSSILCFVTLLPMAPVDKLDPSWKAGMSYAVDHGLKIGKDVIFTFGPLANVYTGFYSPEYDAGYLLISAYVAIAFFMGVYGLFYRQERFVPMLVCAGVVFFWGFKKDAFMMVLPFFMIFILVFEGLPNERRTKLKDFLFLTLLPIVGFLPLIKLSVIVACMVCILLSAFLLAYRRRLVMAGATCLVPVVSCFFAWIAFGQEPASLFNYFSSSLPIIAGYTEAMALYKGVLFVVIYLLGASALLYGVWSVKRNSSILTAITVSLLAIYLFLNFKAGFVRDDTHAMISGVAVMLISLMVWPALQSLRGLGFTCVGFFAGLVVACANASFSPVQHWDLAYSRAYESIKGLTLRIGYPGALAERFSEQMVAVSLASGFPAVSGTTDVYSYGQTALIASGADWSPRPVFQSYSAYTPRLLELNAGHLSSKRAPKNIIFRIQPIDGRLPSLEDGLSWPSIFAMYSPVKLSGEYLVLKRVENTAPVFNEIKTGVGNFDNAIEVPQYSGGLYMTVDIQQTLAGRLISTLFKPSYLIAHFALANGEVREYRVISSMIKTKFLVSPLVESNKDFLSLFSDADLNQAGKVKSVSFSASGSENVIWKPNFNISFYSFQPPTRNAAAPLLGITLPAKVDNPPPMVCTGVVDYLDNRPITGEINRVGKYLTVRGWVTPSVQSYPEGGKAVLLLKGAQGEFAFDMQSSARPDLAKHFESPSMLNAGYDATIDVRELEGDFEVGLGFVRDGIVSKCNGLDSIAKITR